MIVLTLLACVAPELYEAGSPLINPGESEAAFFYEGPGVLVDGDCEGPGLWLDVGPGGGWPYVVAPDELLEVWVVADPGALGGEWVCRVRAGDRIDEVAVLVVVL